MLRNELPSSWCPFGTGTVKCVQSTHAVSHAFRHHTCTGPHAANSGSHSAREPHEHHLGLDGHHLGLDGLASEDGCAGSPRKIHPRAAFTRQPSYHVPGPARPHSTEHDGGATVH